MASSAANSPSVDGRSARWAGQRERRREEFVEAALRAIAAHGPRVSIERIAGTAGVARPQLYKYFEDAADLQRAIADRITELVIAALRSVWEPHGSPNQMIAMAVEAHTRWLADNSDLYRYATLHSQIGRHTGRDAVADVKTVIAKQAARVFKHYLTVFAIDTRIAEPVAFGIVGFVDTSTSRWLEKPRGVSRAELAATLTGCIWRLLDGMLRAGGVRLDPDLPLPPLPATEPD